MASSLPVVLASNQSALAITIASGGVASGAIASGAIASGAIASGAVASGAFASGSIASGAIASGAIAAGAIAAGATSIADNEDVASADGDRGVKILAVRKAAPANTSGTDGDYEFLQLSAGRLWTSATIDAALPAGANAIGKLAANSGVTIGAVEIAAAQTLATVTTVSTVTNLAQMNGAALLMGNGVTGTGSQRVTIASDNTAFTVNPASATAPVSTMNSASASAGVTSPIAAVFDDVAPTAITENSFGFVRMSANRNQYVTLRDAAGNERGLNIDASGQIAVNVAQINGVTVLMGNGASGTGAQRVTIANDSTGILAAVTNVATIGTSVTPGTSAAHLGKAEDAAHTSGDTGVMMLAVRSATAADKSAGATDGDYEPLQVDANGRLHVINSAGVAGDVAHDGVDSGNPVKVGGQARTTNPTAVADADRSNFITDKLGKQVVVGSIRDLKGQQQTQISSSTSETTIVTAVASTFLDLYGLTIANTSATATKVTIKDSTAGTTRLVLYIPAGDTRGFMLNESAAICQATVNTAWTATCGTSVAAIEITALYVKNI